MKKILIVTAHPSSHGHAHKIAEHFADVQKEKKNSVEIIDLYKTNLTQEYLKFEELSDLKQLSPNTKTRHQKISDADHIVLAYPTRWGDAPAILKNWFENTFTAGFAFKYTDKMPQKLLKGKTASVFVTCDAPSFMYTRFPIKIQRVRKFGRLEFCGVKVKNFTVFGFMKKKCKSQKQMDKIYNKVRKISAKI